MNSSGLTSATKIPGFPTDSYLTFALAVPFMQGALFAAMSAGTTSPSTSRRGFLDRLSLTPMSGSALLTGQLAGVVALGLIQALTFLVVGGSRGARPRGRLAAGCS